MVTLLVNLASRSDLHWVRFRLFCVALKNRDFIVFIWFERSSFEKNVFPSHSHCDTIWLESKVFIFFEHLCSAFFGDQQQNLNFVNICFVDQRCAIRLFVAYFLLFHCLNWTRLCLFLWNVLSPTSLDFSSRTVLSHTHWRVYCPVFKNWAFAFCPLCFPAWQRTHLTYLISVYFCALFWVKPSYLSVAHRIFPLLAS